jgi:hypothetical protein
VLEFSSGSDEEYGFGLALALGCGWLPGGNSKNRSL